MTEHPRNSWFRWSLWIALAIQGVGLTSALVFGRDFFWIQDILYLPCWLMWSMGWSPFDFVGRHNVIDDYALATLVNLPLLWLIVVGLQTLARSLRGVTGRAG